MEKPLYRSALIFIALCLVLLPFWTIILILFYIVASFYLPEAPSRKTIEDPNVIDAEFEVKE